MIERLNFELGLLRVFIKFGNYKNLAASSVEY